MKPTVLAALALIAAGAHASFDLMLIPGTDGRIMRYDPQNNINLGSYWANAASAIVAADQQGQSYSYFSNSILTHNYSLGTQVGAFQGGSSIRAMDVSNGWVHQLSATAIRRNNTSTISSSSVSLNATVVWASMATSGSTIFAIGLNATNNICFQTVDQNTFTTGALITTTTTVTSLTTLGKAAVITSPGNTSLVFSYMSGSTMIVGRAPITGSAISSSFLVAPTSGYSINWSMPALLAAHNGFYMVGQDATTSTVMRVTRWDAMSLGNIDQGPSVTFTAPGGAYPTALYAHPAIVIAPEPAAFLPLGIGLLMLRRKRK